VAVSKQTVEKSAINKHIPTNGPNLMQQQCSLLHYRVCFLRFTKYKHITAKRDKKVFDKYPFSLHFLRASK
jgi:hypothetical protein